MRASETVRALVVVAAWVALCAALLQNVRAADDGALTRATQSLARAQALLRTLGEERDALNVRIAELEITLAERDARLARTASDDAAIAALNGRLAACTRALTTANEMADARAAAATARERELNGQLREAKAAQAREHADGIALRKELARTEAQLARAVAHNRALHDAARAVVDDAGLQHGWTAHLADEPLLGIGGARREQRQEDLRRALFEQLDESNLETPPTPAPGADP